jgi:hypothetical protein
MRNILINRLTKMFVLYPNELAHINIEKKFEQYSNEELLDFYTEMILELNVNYW